MKFKGIEFEVKNKPELDKDFMPMSLFNRAYLKEARKPLSIAVERNDKLVSKVDTFIRDTEKSFEADCYYIDRLVKFMLWSKGGYKIYVCGDEKISKHISGLYSEKGKLSFDKEFMSKIYNRKFEVISLDREKCPHTKEKPVKTSRNFDGCRIGFDAGGSDRKVSAVIDGDPVYSEEVVWHPKTNKNPDYHFEGIVSALRKAASKMPRVDAIGVSSAGIYINNMTGVASLFLQVPQELFEKKVKDIYIRAAKEIGDVPLVVANDGDVTALAGSMELGEGKVLGIAMGTSQAAGFVDEDKNITGWLNELAFAPVDANPAAARDEWSGDIGCGVKYFSQDSVIKLAPAAGIETKENNTPAEKLKIVQKLLEENHPGAKKIFKSIGCYLGHSLPLYMDFYDINHVLLLGRVMSGEGGNIILEESKKVLESEYPDVAKRIKIHLPDEKSRRVGQSVAAACLPEVEK